VKEKTMREAVREGEGKRKTIVCQERQGKKKFWRGKLRGFAARKGPSINMKGEDGEERGPFRLGGREEISHAREKKNGKGKGPCSWHI